MLYPESEKPFNEETFRKPPAEYRGTPFWAWNCALEKEELRRQIEVFKKMGYGGFHMHVRTGLETEYLGKEFMDAIRVAVEKARDEKMFVWLYDEDRWPSGAGGGFVTKDTRFRQRRLRLTRRARDGSPLAVFDVELSAPGELERYRRIEEEAPKGFKLSAYLETAEDNPWFNNQAYLDTLNPEAVKRFIEVTHEKYYAESGGDFGGLIPAIFTDEPQLARKGTLAFADDDADVLLPWTDDFPQCYAAAWPGENILDGLPELLWELKDGAVSVRRYRYHEAIAGLFAGSFAGQIGAWCAAHNIMLTGHMMEEQPLECQTAAIGDAMRNYPHFQLPGIDMLCDRREFTTAKQAQSAVRQCGAPGMLSELYGVTNWDFDFRGHKLQGDWQAALGVTVRVPHLSWMSMHGEAKRDYPGTFNYQAAWHEQYPYVEDHFARINTAMTRGRAVVRVAVVHPIESYWLHWGPKENTAAIREEMEKRFKSLCEWLLLGLLDFDYLCESTLPDQCPLGAISGGGFPVGKMRYDVVLVPALETIRKTTLDRLAAFHRAGGRLIFLGDPPEYVDALPDDGPRALWEQSGHIPFERFSLMRALKPVREIEIRDEDGSGARDLLYQLREESDCRWLFIAHAYNPGNPDIPEKRTLRVRVRGEWDLTVCDTLSGNFAPPASVKQNGWTAFTRDLWDHDSLLLRLTKNEKSETRKEETFVSADTSVPRASLLIPHSPHPVILHEPNVLLLDMPEYALDGGAFEGPEEILRLDNNLRHRLGWPLRKKEIPQPWVEHDDTTPREVRLRYSFESETALSGAALALENAEKTRVTLNGEPAGGVSGWYVDKCIKTLPLPPLKAGRNIIDVTIPYGRKTDLEAMYLLGDFGVRVAGTHGTITPPVRELAFGDITRQGLPFYGGNITYRLEADLPAGAFTVEITSWRGAALRLTCDGVDQGVIAYSPYRLRVNNPEKGKRRIDITCYGTRINTFGQLHNNIERQRCWWGPNSWRFEGPAWSYEYRFWPQGVLKSPEIRVELPGGNQ